MPVPLLLDADQVLGMATKIRGFIAERFKTRKLCATSDRVLELTRRAADRADRLDKPNWFLRFVLLLFLSGMLGAGGYGLCTLHLDVEVSKAIEFAQGLDSALNIAMLMVAGAFFLLSIDTRAKRGRALSALHELRSLAHVIDMHQLDKDPYSVVREADKRSSDDLGAELDADEMMRYLDACSDLLSIVSKIAALYAQHLRDSVALRAVDEIEALAGRISQKIWVKIEMVQRAKLAEKAS